MVAIPVHSYFYHTLPRNYNPDSAEAEWDYSPIFSF